MTEKNHTLMLLKQCSQGVETGVMSIVEALKHANDQSLREMLNDYKAEHERLRDEIQAHIEECAHGDPEETEKNTFSGSMAQTMAHMKMSVELTLMERDTKVAELITEGCDMGTRTLTQYINEYDKADQKSKNLAGKLVRMEDEMREKLRKYL